MNTRDFWLAALERLAGPPLQAMAAGSLHRRLPVRHHPGCDPGRIATMRLELSGRLLSGLAPWFECPGLEGAEAQLRDRLLLQARAGLVNGTDPSHPDYWQGVCHNQSLVDGAFVAQALLRAPNALWAPLDAETKERTIGFFSELRRHVPWFNNWLLFSGIIEAFRAAIGEDWDPMRVDYAVRQHEQWYVGDGHYGDGPDYHADYYNSFVIQPMLHEILAAVSPLEGRWNALAGPVRDRLARYAAIQERMIGQDGTWPVVGRSVTYRTGAFHALSFAAWKGLLPAALHPGQVRCALTAAIGRGLYPDSNYDAQGWLEIGLNGPQPGLAEVYITTASGYLAACIFPALGLPRGAPFWVAAERPWTARQVWTDGSDLPADSAFKQP